MVFRLLLFYSLIYIVPRKKSRCAEGRTRGNRKNLKSLKNDVVLIPGSPFQKACGGNTFPGFGCSATPLLRDQFRISTFSVAEYCRRTPEGKTATALKQDFTQRQRMIHRLFRRAYTARLALADFESSFGVPLKHVFGFELNPAKAFGMATESDGRLEMTLKGTFRYHCHENFYPRDTLTGCGIS